MDITLANPSERPATGGPASLGETPSMDITLAKRPTRSGRSRDCTRPSRNRSLPYLAPATVFGGIREGRSLCDAHLECLCGARPKGDCRDSSACDQEAVGDRQVVLRAMQSPALFDGDGRRAGVSAKGIGRAMLEDAKRIARDWPGDTIGWTPDDSPAGAGEFYAKCGFGKSGGSATARRR